MRLPGSRWTHRRRDARGARTCSLRWKPACPVSPVRAAARAPSGVCPSIPPRPPGWCSCACGTTARCWRWSDAWAAMRAQVAVPARPVRPWRKPRRWSSIAICARSATGRPPRRCPHRLRRSALGIPIRRRSQRKRLRRPTLPPQGRTRVRRPLRRPSCRGPRPGRARRHRNPGPRLGPIRLPATPATAGPIPTTTAAPPPDRAAAAPAVPGVRLGPTGRAAAIASAGYLGVGGGMRLGPAGLGAGSEGAGSDASGMRGEVLLTLQVHGRWLALELGAGASSETVIRLRSASPAELRLRAFPLRLGAGVRLPALGGVIVPAAALNVDLLSFRAVGLADPRSGTRYDPAAELGLGYQVERGPLYLRAALGGGLTLAPPGLRGGPGRAGIPQPGGLLSQRDRARFQAVEELWALGPPTLSRACHQAHSSRPFHRDHW